MLRIAVLLLLAALAFAGLFALPAKEWLVGALQWAKDMGPWGGLIIGAAYVPACLFFVPGTILTLGAGYALGLGWGIAAASVGSTLGATAAFFTGRTLARGWVETWVARNPRFAALDHAIAQQGFKVVLLTRLSPIFPFNVMNYAYGITRVSTRDYVLASWCGMFPATALVVYVGSAAKSLADLVQGRVDRGPGYTALYVLGLVATVAVTILVGRLARRELHRTLDHAAPPSA
jgi:uncharacterized membrane protein YdjX (TVP38/TMEM64 family)